MKKIAFVCLPGLHTFIESIAEALAGTYEVVKVFSNKLDEVYAAVQQVDIVWLEWANEMAVQVTQQMIKPGKRVIMRLHSYEALVPQYLQQINWAAIQDVIYVSPFIKDYVAGMIPQQVKLCTHHVISNGLVSGNFVFDRYKGGGDELNVGMLGHLNDKKGIMNLCQAFYAIHQEGKRDGIDVYLKVGGTWQDKRYENYFFHFMDKADLIYNLKQVEQVKYGGASEFFKDVDVVLCTSPWESQNMSVMEGMLCGCKPAVHDFPGSEHHYPFNTWLTYEDLVNLIYRTGFEAQKYRDYVIDNYSFADKLEEIKAVIG